jgi:hypothetical protein
MATVPFLTTYDPPGSSEGTLDPLGLYMISDQLATQLVPAVRERMLRIRFVTAMTVGALVTEELDANDRYPHVLPFLVWEWMVVEAIVRAIQDDDDLWGLPGSLVTRKAISEHGYVDERSYLKTPRVFGFHGVYKRLAIHLGLIDSHLRFRALHGDELVREWERDQAIGQFDANNPLFQKWRKAVEVSLRENPVRTRTSPTWTADDWKELADAFVPHRIKRRERRYLKRLLHAADDHQLGALVPIWNLLASLDGQDFDEHSFHDRLRATAPDYAILLRAITSYEAFCRNLIDAFDILRAESSRQDVQGFHLPSLRNDAKFRSLADRSHNLYQRALQDIGEVDPLAEARLIDRFDKFAEPFPSDLFAVVLCEHHETVQQAKSREGKRPWFDRMGPERIYMRQNYRTDYPALAPQQYVHEYRMSPILRFFQDIR